MVEPGQRAGAGLERLHVALFDVAEGPGEELDRDHAVQEEVLGDVDAAHAASADELQQLALAEDASDFEGGGGVHR